MNHDVSGKFFMSIYVYQNHVEVYFLVIFSMSLEIIIEQESDLPPEVKVPRHVQNANGNSLQL